MMRMRKKTMKITHWYASDMSQNDMHIAEENLMPRKRYLRNILIAALMAVLLASCASVEEAVPESPVLADTDERAVDGLFDISGLDVTSYRIRGEGPDGAWFDWVESDTPKIALADVRRGLWTIYAQGLNRYGEPVIQGKLETFLSENSPVDNLIFDEQYGTGDVRSALAWNPAQVMHPAIDVYLRADDGEYMPRPSDEVTIGQGTAIWAAENIPSGSYIARFVLKDGSTPVSGAAAAVRIIDDSTSIGQVRLTIGDLSHVYGIELSNMPADTLIGHLELTGREASLEEIKIIKDKVPEMEIEAFAHGAMCIAYSGRCLMSAYMAGRSGNSGECAHSCRWDWRLYGEKQEGREEKELFLEEKERPGELFPVYEGDGFTSILSSKDLSMIDHLKEMKDAGVTSFKIEGRMKSLYYTALITRAYRKGLDVLEGKIPEEKAAPFINEIEKVSHREFTTGFYFSREDADKTTKGETSSEYSLVGTIGEKTGENLFKFNSMNKIDAGTPIEYIGPDLLFTEDRDYKLLNPDTMEERDWVCHGHPCLIKTDKEIREGFIVRARLKK